jgi:hypothetical protein
VHFEISQIVEASDAGLVLRTLEEQLRDLGKGVERSQNRLMALGIGPSPVAKNIHDRSIFLATEVDGTTKVTVDVNYQASGLLGAAETQDEVVRGKILRALRQTRTELWYRGAGGAPPDVVEAEEQRDARAVAGVPAAPPGANLSAPFIVEAPTHGGDNVVEWKAPLSGNWTVSPAFAAGISEPSKDLVKDPSKLNGGASRYEHYRMPGLPEPEYPAPVAPLISAAPVMPPPMPAAIHPGMPPPAPPVLAPVVPINVNDMSFVKTTPSARKSDKAKREADKAEWMEWKEERRRRAVRILLMWAMGATVVIGWLVGWELGIWSSPIHMEAVTVVQPVRPVLQDEQDLWKWLQNWSGVEGGLSPAAQVGFYADPVTMYFRTADLTRAGLLAAKQRLVEGQDASTELRIEDMKIVDQDAEGANIQFTRHFISLPPHGERSDELVPGTLVVKKVGGNWRISEEHNADEKKVRPGVKR